MDKDKEELDITASFTVEGGVSSETLTAAVEELVGKDNLQKKLRRANDEGEWYEIGNSFPNDPFKEYIVLGDDDFIKDGETYRKVTVKFKPSSKAGVERNLGRCDFVKTFLTDIREFRDKLKQKIVNQKLAS